MSALSQKLLSVRGLLEAVGEALRRRDRETYWLAFCGMLVLYLLPLALSRFLPFSDLPGHLGVVGALVHRGRGEGAIDSFFWVRPRFGPNSLEFYFTWALGRIFDVVTAAKLFAMVCVAALPVSVAFLLHVFRRNRWLVFLVFPLSYPRIMWYGFMGSALGVSLMLASVAAAHLAASRASLAHSALLAALLVLVGMSHPFFLAATLPLVAVVLILGLATARRRGWASLAAPAALIPTVVAFWGWFSAVFFPGHPAGSGHGAASGRPALAGFLADLLERRPPWSVYLRWLKEWSIGAYRGPMEGRVLWCMVLLFAGCLAVGLVHLSLRLLVSVGLLGRGSGGEQGAAGPVESATRAPRRVLAPLRWSGGESVVPVAVFLCVALAYVLLPGVLRRPVYWWAVSQRLVTPLLILALLLIPGRVPGRFAALVMLPAIMASAYYGAYLSRDFRYHWNGVEMRGLEPSLVRIPRGKRVLGLYDDRERHYAHFQLHFGASYYVALRGGFAVPFPAAPGYRKLAWVYPRRMPPSPPWGKLRMFSYRRHGRHFDYFLVKRHSDGRTRWRRRFPQACVEHLGDRGLWTLLRRRRRPGC